MDVRSVSIPGQASIARLALARGNLCPCAGPPSSFRSPSSSPRRSRRSALPHLELLDTAVLRAPRLIESSGAAPSHRVRGVVWTHNDSGDEPRLYATDSAGDDLGSVLVAGADNVDWEDLGSGPCPDHAGWCLYPADIGDNRHNRDHIVVYRLAEPEPPRGRADTLRRVPLESATALRYPDHPHDAEAIAVDPSGRIFIITKELSKPPLVFLVPRRARRATVRRRGHAPARGPPRPRSRASRGCEW